MLPDNAEFQIAPNGNKRTCIQRINFIRGLDMKSCERLETAEYREERLGIEDTLNSGKLICTSGCHFSLFHTPLASEKLLC